MATSVHVHVSKCLCSFFVQVLEHLLHCTFLESKSFQHLVIEETHFMCNLTLKHLDLLCTNVSCSQKFFSAQRTVCL